VAIFKELENKVQAILDNYRPVLIRIVDILLEKESIDGGEFRSFLNSEASPISA
jgi:ATP-dependent Zn protease